MTKIIRTTKGEEIYVSEQDYENLSLWTWCLNSDGYPVSTRQINKEKKTVLMHREIMKATEGQEIDHKDRNPRNNIRPNLRIVTHQENMHNRSIQRNNKSGYIGVHLRPNGTDWCAQIKVNGKIKHLGHFKCPKEASAAYQEAKKLYHPSTPKDKF
jgi:hypothetical protein